MLTILAYILILIVLDIAALYWGFNSSDGPDSSEWCRRRQSVWPEEEDWHTELPLPLTATNCSQYC